jgi:hypothetical protein
MMCLRVSYKKKLASFKVTELKKSVGSGVGSGSESISQRYGSEDPDPHQNFTDPQHCNIVYVPVYTHLNRMKIYGK